MIKFACNAMVRDPDQEGAWIDAETLIDVVYELRFDMIDFQLDRGMWSHDMRSSDFDYLAGIKARCHDRGLPIGFLGISDGLVEQGKDEAGETIGVALTREERTARIAELMEAVDAAVVLGAPLIRLFAGDIPAATPDRESVWTGMVGCFQEVCDYAAGKAVRIGLHNHAPAVAPTGATILRLLREIDRPNCTHILDSGQWHGSIGSGVKGESDPGIDIYRFMEQTAPHASYVRAKIYKIDSGREEWRDYDRIAAILQAVDYNGPVSVVYEDAGNNCDYREAWRLAVAHLRQVFG